MAARLTVINTTRGVHLAECGRIADNLYSRVIGLLHDKVLEYGDGLWIIPCNSIHSMGMRFRFDAVFLDKNLRVVHLVRDMKPWRMSRIVFSAHSVLEIPAGLIFQSGTQPGDQFEMREQRL